MIFYKQTKAYHDSGNNIVWTYLTWPNNASTPGDASVADSFMPSLSWSTGSAPSTSAKDLGKILTNKVNTTIAGAWSFSQSISTGGLSATGNISTTGALSAASASFTNGLTMGSSRSTPLVANTNLAVAEDIRAKKSLLLFYTGSTDVWSTMQKADVGSTVPFFQLEANTASTCQFNYHTTGVANNIFVVSESGAKITFNSQFYVSNGANITGALNVSGGISGGSNLTLASYCQASYFNATSDRRAKENIQLASYSALELIKKVQVYNYNYKIDSERVTGIMAQDLLEAQPKELDLVSNTQATGENGDYMSIKTDKLISVLWKAIQEQQEQIEELKKELKTLRGGN